MQLRNARLCLDCEELHQEQQCPVCASEMFAFLASWVPVEERRKAGRSRPRARMDGAQARKGRWMLGGAAGVAAFAVSRFLLRNAEPAGWTEPGAAPPDQSPPNTR